MPALLADTGFAFGLALIMALAGLVVVVGVFGLMLKAIGAIVRGLFGGLERRPHPPTLSARHGARACRHPGCGHHNLPQARYCVQCGMPLQGG